MKRIQIKYSSGISFLAVMGVAGCSVDVPEENGMSMDVAVSAYSSALPCTKPSDCSTGFCVDGVCCNSACLGSCQACTLAKKGNGADGTCGNIRAGLDPDNECAFGDCNGSRGCTKNGVLLGKGNPCTASTQCSSGFCVDGVCCDSSCASTCKACTAALKGSGSDGACGYIAPNTDPQNECATSDCNGLGACGSPAGTSPNGNTCSSGATCLSGCCVDGVCCDSACVGTCKACTAAKKGSGANGSCGNIEALTDPDNECAFGDCNGSGACGFVIALGLGNGCSSNSQCASGFCANGVCCNNACSGNCLACDLPGSAGTCSNACAGPCLGTMGFPDAPVPNTTITLDRYNLSVDAADFNGDGIQDLVVANASSNFGSTSGAVELLFGIGNGSFQVPIALPSSGAPAVAIVADVNNDGKKDIVAAYQSSGGIGVFLNQGNGAFAASVTYGAGSIGSTVSFSAAHLLQVADINGDGLPDIAVVNTAANTVNLLFGQGNGTFGNHVDVAAPSSPRAIAIADFNGDSILDLAVTTYVTSPSNFRVSLLMGQGNGAFAAAVNYPIGATALSLEAADFNGDGKPDLAASSYVSLTQQQLYVLLNQGNGAFANPIIYDAHGTNPIVTADLNGDSILDLALAEWSSSLIDVFWGQGNGSFAAPTSYSTKISPYGLVAVDVDQDNDQDLVTSAIGVLGIAKNSGTGDFGWEIGSSPSIPMANSVTRSGDVNGDGTADLVGVGLGAINVAFGQTNGGFAPPVSIVGPAAVNDAYLADMNGDGQSDLVYYYPNTALIVRLNQGNGSFGPEIVQAISDNTYTLAIADFDNDGHLDVAYTYMWGQDPSPMGNDGFESANMRVWHGNGNGTFLLSQTLSVGGGTVPYPMLRNIPITASDLDLDGDVDIVTYDYKYGTDIFRNQGNGQFSGNGVAFYIHSSSNIYAVDLDGDHFPDLINSGLSLTISRGLGTNFGPEVFLDAPAGARDVVVQDMNGDGLKDLAFFGGGSRVGILLNQGNFTFGSQNQYVAGFSPTSLTAGDWNHDGKMDLAAQNSAPNSSSPANVTLLYNTCLP